MTKGVVHIDGHPIGTGHPPYIISEMSGNHNGDIARALRLIEAAKAAGADAVKLQTYTADTITLDHDGPDFVLKSGLWAGQRLYDLYREASTPWEWHERLFAHARSLGITIFSSPFDATAVDLLEKLQTPAYKIASFELVDLPLIERVSATGKPVIMSTGMATKSEIAEAIAAARSTGNEQIALLHCTSAYPAEFSDANLRAMQSLRSEFGRVVGLSDHTLGVTAPIAAVALGASLIEKHFTLARSDGGPDAAFSLEASELADLCRLCRQAWESLGTTEIGRAPGEESSLVFRRSLYAVAEIAAGEELNTQNVRSIRPGFGLAPKHLKALIGRRARNKIPRGTPLSWDLVE